ncbi:MAG: electron transfer flavoprotein subunit alpha/FixB family protein [Oscillospiraceae bacterium]|nr:electron transfer flavoprotein subunit alpha/FixB family protein [Oscillospiraceae bacterium]
MPLSTKEEIVGIIEKYKPNVVLWGSDSISKRLSSQVASALDIGLCADCTSLETDGETLFMIRPALSGSVTARIKSLTKPAMATVRTTNNDTKDIILCIGYGAKDHISKLKAFAESIGADVAATRKAVDNSLMPYSSQVGLTGKMVASPIYIAVGVSGAVHHTVGMEQSGTVIAINPDKNAPIFDYADFGILSKYENCCN